MIEKINLLLSPVENFVKQYRKYIGYVLLFLSFCSFGYFFIDGGVKESGSIAMNILWGILFLPIISQVFGVKLAQTLMLLRKEMGILMGTLAFVHGSLYMSEDPTHILSGDFWLQDGMISYLAFGFFALVLTMILTLTSNMWSMRFLGKNWKRLHRLAYAILILSVIHVVLLKWYTHFEFGQVLVLCFYILGKILQWKGISFVEKYRQV